MVVLKLVLFFMLLFVYGIGAQTNATQYSKQVFPENKWLVTKPENVGFSSEKLENTREAFEASGGIAMLIIKNGYVIGDWGETERNFDCRSIRKSLINSIYGIYAEKGKVDLSMRLSDIGVDDKNKLTKNELETQIQYLLSSSSGIYHPAAFDQEVHRNKPARGIHRQGEHFVYNNWSFNILSTIFKKLTNKDLLAAFDEYIAKPLQMEHFDFRYNTGYLYQPELSEHPAYLFQISTKDLARYALLYLNEGNWKGEQLISKQWVLESISTKIETGKGFYYNYGYLWWVSKRGKGKNRRPYLARGAQSQYIYIDPINNLIVIFRDNPESTIKVKKSQGYPLIGSVYSAMDR